MKKTLKLGGIRVYGSDVCFDIAEQSHRNDSFGDDSNSYKASNGVSLYSLGFPAVTYIGRALSLCVCGHKNDLDTIRVCTSMKNFNRILKAVQEYNEHFGDNCP